MGVKLSVKTGPTLPAVPDNLTTLRLFLLLTLALGIASLPQLLERGKQSGHDLGSYSLLWVLLLGGAGLLLLIELLTLAISFSHLRERFGQTTVRVLARLSGRSGLSILGLVLPWAAYVLVVLWRYQKHFVDFLPQVWLFWLLVAVGAAFLLLGWKKLPYFWALLFVGIVYSALIKALGYLPDISAYPFSLEWSEASRYYYASLPFSKWLYGAQYPLSFLHPSRYLLQSIAFIVPGAGIAFHRFWQVFLWIALSLAAGWALARRLSLRNWVWRLAAALWAALFLLQGPVYYHLLVCVILVLWGFDPHRFWKSLIFVALASAWAGISRVNWIPVPAMLATALYLIEVPFCAVERPAQKSILKQGARYVWPILAWAGVGGLTALAAQAAYVLASGHNNVESFGSSFTSALLWYRLLPSPTFRTGVLPAVLFVAGPLLVLLIGSWWAARSQWHVLRILSLTALAAILFVGGLVVSTKIGGGSNIHNLDAFLALLLVMASLVGMGRYATENGAPARAWQPWPLLLAVVLLPVIWNINIGGPFVQRDFKQANYDLGELTKTVQKFAAKGEVLFISQRQLEMFNFIPGVRLVPDYELLTLTEMSISNNQSYFEHFYQDLQNHRFALIVVGRQQLWLKDPTRDGFAEENNAWVEKVSTYLLKYYKEYTFFDTQGISLLVPR